MRGELQKPWRTDTTVGADPSRRLGGRDELLLLELEDQANTQLETIQDAEDVLKPRINRTVIEIHRTR